MTNHSHAPSGLGRRARRLSDQETERRMLAAAVAMVRRTGLTVSLDHISFEDVIRDADVARSAVYRRWPYKDLFFSDLVKELAKEAIPPALLDEEYELIRRVVAEQACQVLPAVHDAGQAGLLGPGERSLDLVAQLAIGQAQERRVQSEVGPPFR